MHRHEFARRILVCVTGLTPQVVTETVYALAKSDPPWVPTEVHVLTTVTGAQRARLLLLADDRDQFGALVRDHDLHGVQFDVSHIHVLQDAEGRALDDIRTQADNLATADAILAKVAHFAADADCALHVSLAGGRKSMGFFAGYALSLYGREQDRLSHVLVSPAFETNPAFFFPPRQPRVLISRSGQPVSTADAQIELADIPFVRLRDNLPAELDDGGRFIDAVAAAQRMAQPPRLILRADERAIVCAGKQISLSPVRFAVYAWHARRLSDLDDPAVPMTDFNAVGSPLRRDLSGFGRSLYPNAMAAAAEAWTERPWDDDALDHGQWLSEQRARINEAISAALGPAGERIYGIESVSISGRRTSHRLSLAATHVTWEEQ